VKRRLTILLWSVMLCSTLYFLVSDAFINHAGIGWVILEAGGSIGYAAMLKRRWETP